MPQEYGSHADYMSWVYERAQERQAAVEEALRTAFASFIESRTVDVILFSNVSVMHLAQAIIS